MDTLPSLLSNANGRHDSLYSSRITYLPLWRSLHSSWVRFLGFISTYSSILGVCSIFYLFIYFSGSYTFAKTLEYKAKQGLQSGEEVTVVPPAEYRDRFVNALEGYFIACPG